MANLYEIWAAYAEGEGRWEGCNWPTQFGYLGLDLNGTVSEQARATSAHWLDVAADEATEDVLATGRESALLGRRAEWIRITRRL